MARVTVEDCAEVVQSRFELVALAAQRAKKISAGGDVTVSRDNDKDAVIALREIALRTVNVETLKEDLISSLQKNVNVDQYGVEDDSQEIERASIEPISAEEEVKSYVETSDDHISSENIYGADDIEIDD